MIKYCAVLISLLLVSACSSDQSASQKKDGVIEVYKPSEPISFPHVVHAENNIDCKYCHNSITETDKAELATNICTDCHKMAKGEITETEQKQDGNPMDSSRRPPKVTKPTSLAAPFKPNDYNKVYNSKDELWQEGEFRNGSLLDGKVYEYSNDGILTKIYTYKKGIFHSEEPFEN